MDNYGLKTNNNNIKEKPIVLIEGRTQVRLRVEFRVGVRIVRVGFIVEIRVGS